MNLCHNMTILLLFYHSGVTIGLQGTSYSTAETGGPLGICAQMFLGNLERNVSMTLVSSDGTAVGMV